MSSSTPASTASATSASAPDAEQALPAGGAGLIGLLVASAFVMILQETIMSIALPALVTELGVAVTTAQWLSSGFLLTMAVVVPITGFLLQRFTPRQVYLASMSLFSLGTLVCALAPGFVALLAGRIVQASGTAVMAPLVMTSVMRLVPPQRRGGVIGTIMIVIAVAPAVGPTLSGVLLTTLGWRWMFWVVLPIALLALTVGAWRLRIDTESRRAPLDVASVVLSVLAFGGLVFGLSGAGESASGEPAVSPWVPAAVGAVAMVVFVARQLRLQRTEAALLDLRPFGYRTFVVSIVLAVLGMMALFGVLILLPLYLQNVLGVTAFVTGLAVLPGGLAMGLLGPVVGRLYDRVGARRLVIPGATVTTGALWAFTTLGAASPVWLVIVMHVVLVTGLSLMFTPLMTDALAVLPRELDSHGSAIFGTAQQLAAAAGTALFVSIMALASQDPTSGTDAAGAHAAFLVAAGIATVALPLTLLIGRRRATR